MSFLRGDAIIADPEEFARALAAVEGIAPPNTSMQRAMAASLGHTFADSQLSNEDAFQRTLQRSMEDSRIANMTEDEQIALATRQSLQDDSNRSGGGDPGPSSRARENADYVIIDDEEDMQLDEDDDIGYNGAMQRGPSNNSTGSNNSYGTARSQSRSSQDSIVDLSKLPKDFPRRPRPAQTPIHGPSYIPPHQPHTRARPMSHPRPMPLVGYATSEGESDGDEVKFVDTTPNVPKAKIILPKPNFKETTKSAKARALPNLDRERERDQASKGDIIDLSDDEMGPVAGPGPSTSAHRNGNGSRFGKIHMSDAPRPTTERLTAPTDSIGPTAPRGLAGLDRAQMEAERKARQEKARGGKPQPDDALKRKRVEESSDEEIFDEGEDQQHGTHGPESSKKRRLEDRQASKPTTTGGYTLSGGTVKNSIFVDDQEDALPTTAFAARDKVKRLNGDNGRPEKGDMCWEGEVRSTWIGSSRLRSNRKAWRIQDVIGDVTQLSMVICAAYHWDDAWAGRIFPDPQDVPFIRITHPDKERNGAFWPTPVNDPNRLPGAMNCAAWIPGGYGTMHMKFMLLFYKSGRMRVVVSSANVVDYDWERIENIAFVQDLLPKNAEIPRNQRTFPDHDMPRIFRKLFQSKFQLSRALKHLEKNHSKGKDLPLTDSVDYMDLAKWDWEPVKAKMVISMPGNYEGPACETVGQTMLSKILRDERWLPGVGEEVVADFQSSSLMQFKERWSSIFHRSMKGIDGYKMAELIGPEKKMKKDHKPVWPPIKVIFPSLFTVDHSTYGRSGGGTMFCDDKKWRPDTKMLFYDSNSKAGKVLQHTKMIVARFVPRKQAQHYLDKPAQAPPKPKVMALAQTTGGMVATQPHPSSPSSPEPSAEPVEEIRPRKEAFGERMRINLDPELFGGGSGVGEGAGGWWYLGSHNFSKAAWGAVSWAHGVPKTFCSNFEMGLVFPLPRKDIDDAVDRLVPWFNPPRKYGKKDKPWMQQGPH